MVGQNPKTQSLDKSIADAPTSGHAAAGAAVYSRLVLSIYDLFVLGFSNRFVWRCPTPDILKWYNRHVTANHLDVGVGTGYFLERCRFPSPRPRLVLMDLNPNCLDIAARRVARFAPATRRQNILDPIPVGGEKFDSIGLNYVLHCLPGAFDVKAVAFDHLKPLLNPGGIIFGSTLLSHGIERTFAARRLMDFYNRRRIFSNANDSLDALRIALEERFETWEVTTLGCAALFWART